jgi:DNA ligase-1
MLFREVAEYFDRTEKASSRLVMTDILAELFDQMPGSDAKKIIYLLQGRIAPQFDGKEIGFGEKLISEGVAKATGFTREEVDKLFNKVGDLGTATEELVTNKKQGSLYAQELTIEKVFNNLKKMSEAEGTGSQELKKKLLAELFNSATPKEARYIARIPLGNIRLGIGDPTVMDAFAIMLSKKEQDALSKELKDLENKKDQANPKGLRGAVTKQTRFAEPRKSNSFYKEQSVSQRKKETEDKKRKIKVQIREEIEAAYNVFSDLGEIAEILKTSGLSGLKKIHLHAGTPIRPTAAERLPSAKEIMEKLGKCAAEAKYDGFRVAVHKNNDKVKIFSRQSEDITNMFPEIIESAKTQLSAKECIVEGEALAFNEETNEYYPFQVTIQRKRKYEVEKKSKEYPLKLFLFDTVLIDGENLIEKPLHERRARLAAIIKEGDIITLSEQKIIDNASDLEKFFEEKISQGLEGIIAKDLNAPYIAGARKFAWIKLKRSYRGALEDTVDVVIIGYYKGKGKRTKFGLGALLVAVYNNKIDVFESIAKIGTGMSEEMLAELEGILSKISAKKKPARVISELEPDYWVTPHYIIETRADEITRSPMHSCGKEKGAGYALRFPRMIKIRSDKKAEEATTTEEIKKMFAHQKRVSIEATQQEQ